MLKTFKDDFQCETIHAWGMTETSPLGVVNQLKAKHLQLDDSSQSSLRYAQGRHRLGSAFEFVMLKRAVPNWLQMDKPQDICKLKGTGL
jgi:acyl-CoA synthetase (AMP-forming)/AMP-acid ligase II